MRKLQSVFVGILAGMLMLWIGGFIQGKEGDFASLSQISMGSGLTEALAEPLAIQYIDPLPEGTFNVQIQALEVTQGVQAGARGSELSHELGHALGLDHAGNGHREHSLNPDYPDDHGRVEANAYGFDVGSIQAIPPDFGLEGTHDFMSYDGSNPEWTSIYTWETLTNLLGQPN
jgi:hypothetical protein